MKYLKFLANERNEQIKFLIKFKNLFKMNNSALISFIF
jgi:hypothetical protein